MSIASSPKPASEVWSLDTSLIGDRACGVCFIDMAHDERLLEGDEERGVVIISIDERLLKGGEQVGASINIMIQSPQAQEGRSSRGSMGILMVEGTRCLRWFA
jgi:hypothetical protein